MTSEIQVSRSVPARDLKRGDTVRLLNPEAQWHPYDVQRVIPSVDGSTVVLTVRPHFMPTTFTETRRLGVDRMAEVS